MGDTVSYDLGLVDSITPEAVGTPGQRTFKITATSGRGQAIVWMEKEQLFQIGISIKQFTSTRPSARNPAPFITGPAARGPVQIEFKAGDMSLRHDAASDVFTLLVSNVSEDDEDAGQGAEAGRGEEEKAKAVEVLASFTRAVAEKLADRSLEVVAAGRRPCPLCGGPMDPGGHFCVRKNGHREQQE